MLPELRIAGDKSISCCGGLCANLLVWGLRNAWAVVLSSIGISERSQGLFALVAAHRTDTLPLALLRHMLRMGGSVGGGNKAPGDYMLAHFLSFWNQR